MKGNLLNAISIAATAASLSGSTPVEASAHNKPITQPEINKDPTVHVLRREQLAPWFQNEGNPEWFRKVVPQDLALRRADSASANSDENVEKQLLQRELNQMVLDESLEMSWRKRHSESVSLLNQEELDALRKPDEQKVQEAYILLQKDRNTVPYMLDPEQSKGMLSPEVLISPENDLNVSPEELEFVTKQLRPESMEKVYGEEDIFKNIIKISDTYFEQTGKRIDPLFLLALFDAESMQGTAHGYRNKLQFRNPGNISVTAIGDKSRPTNIFKRNNTWTDGFDDMARTLLEKYVEDGKSDIHEIMKIWSPDFDARNNSMLASLRTEIYLLKSRALIYERRAELTEDPVRKNHFEEEAARLRGRVAEVNILFSKLN